MPIATEVDIIFWPRVLCSLRTISTCFCYLLMTNMFCLSTHERVFVVYIPGHCGGMSDHVPSASQVLDDTPTG